MQIERLIAIDVHVHLEYQGELGEADRIAQSYFGTTAPRDAKRQAEYYRSRNIGCVVFTVDEQLTGRRYATNDEVAAFAAENADIAIAFASVNPLRGQAAVAEAKDRKSTRLNSSHR